MRESQKIWPLGLLLGLGHGCGATPPVETTPRGASDPPPAATAAAPEPVFDADFLEQYASTLRFRLGRPAAIEVSPGGDEVLFLRSPSRSFVRSLYAFDPKTGEERVLLTAEQLLEGAEEELSAQERARRERMRLAARGITEYQLSRDGTRMLVPLSGRLFVVERSTNKVTELPDEGGYANAPLLSPDGTKVACVREGDVYVVDVKANRQRRLTDTANEHVENGMPEFVAQEEMGRYRGLWWSPDSERLVVQVTDNSNVEHLYASDPMHPDRAPDGAAYPRAGTPNADVRLGIVSARGGALRFIEWDRVTYPYVASVRWTEDAPLSLLVQNRRQTEERLLSVDPRRGTTETLLIERDSAWLNIDQAVPRWIQKGTHFLWTTEREGAWQLELRGAGGELVGALTPPELGFERLLHVDEKAGVAWIAASGEPTETDLYRVPLDPASNEGPSRVTTAPGVHGGYFGRDSDVWVHASGGLDRDLTYVVRRTNGDAIGALENKAEKPGFVAKPGLVTVGERELRAAIVRPRNFDPKIRYPVIVSVYGGPGIRVVRASRERFLYEQWVADHGFVVVSMDGRGTPGRGRDFERAIARNVIDAPLEDQVAGLRALGKRFPEMDLGRVGIYGWSFGGYFAAMAVMREPEVFHVGVAGAPVADWRDYDTHYTERYMGLPDDNPEGYDRASVLTWAGKLARPLLIVHGTSDDNVYFTHAIKMSDALLKADRKHDFLPLSGFTHMVADPDMTRALQHRIVQFLKDGLLRRAPSHP